nr:L-type lectin-domain containing receptor kinase IV.1-like [Ipomoea batatas]
MFVKLLILIVYSLRKFADSEDTGFTYTGFRSANLSLDGLAELTSNGLLKLTNSSRLKTGHAFHPIPIRFKNTSTASALSFSTTFVFAIVPEYSTLGGHGLAFAIAPKRTLLGGLPAPYIGLLNDTTNGNLTNHLFAVEFDTLLSREFEDINDNHVGININQMKSQVSKPAGYVGNGSLPQNLTLISGEPMQAWVEYSGPKKQINVSLAPINVPKPKIPLLSLSYDLTPIIGQTMYLGFSSATGSITSIHYVLGWSFKVNGVAEALEISRLPNLPRLGSKKRSEFLSIGLPVILPVSILALILGAAYYVMIKKKFAEVLEDWELEYGPHRPIEPAAPNEDDLLVEWVFSCWSRGEILQAIDPKLGLNYVTKEANLVLKLGLLCSLLDPTSRPSMQQVVLYLDGSMVLPELSSLSLSTAGLIVGQSEGFDDFVGSLSSSGERRSAYCSSVANSILSGGR